MKTRVNLTLDEKIARDAKRYAAKHDCSLSQLVENYLQKIAARENEDEPLYIKALGSIKKVKVPATNKELWAEYCEANKKKYGF